jgi:hypothetical protein
MAENSDFGNFGRYQETPINEMSPAMKDAYDFTKKLRGLVPGPHKIWLANPTLLMCPQMRSAFSNKENTMTKKTIELGGRTPLSAPASLSPGQQKPLAAKLEDGSLIGPVPGNHFNEDKPAPDSARRR